jgi:hypothetical protein
LDPVSPVLIANAIAWSSRGQTSCRIFSSNGRFSVRLYDQPACRIIHLVNHTADPVKPYSEIQPVDQVSLDAEIPTGKIAARVRALWAGQTLNHQVSNGRLHVRLPRLGEYEVLILEWN